MQGKFLYNGNGAKVPGTDFGMSASLFKLWFKPSDGDFVGYTTASNQGLLGSALIETPVVNFSLADSTEEPRFASLHGSTVDVTISPSLFVKDGGIATIKMQVKTNDANPPGELTFFSDECKGYSATVGDIHFVATLLQLPADETDPTGSSYVPW